VRTAVANANAAGPLGTFEGGERAVTIATNDQMRAISAYEPLVIKAANGSVVRLSAIASIEPGTRNSRSFGWYNGQPSICSCLTKSADANVDRGTVDRVREMLPEIKKWIPAGVRHRDPVRPHPDHPRSVFDVQSRW
jgi:multidrug efflux pump